MAANRLIRIGTYGIDPLTGSALAHHRDVFRLQDESVPFRKENDLIVRIMDRLPYIVILVQNSAKLDL